MKFKKIHIFILILALLLFCCMGFSALEGLANNDNQEYDSGGNRINKALALGSNYNPMDNDPNKNNKPGFDQLTNTPKNKIPAGNEDLYILKSQIVPPVCPKCPDVKRCDTKQDCPACPAPQRCPEKPYECKMVPKYSDPNVTTHLPRPVLNSFDSFA